MTLTKAFHTARWGGEAVGGGAAEIVLTSDSLAGGGGGVQDKEIKRLEGSEGSRERFLL